MSGRPIQIVQISKVSYLIGVDPGIHSSPGPVLPGLTWQITTELTKWLYGCIITNRSASPEAISAFMFIIFGQISTQNAPSSARVQLSATLPGIINFEGNEQSVAQVTRQAAYAGPDLK